MSEEVLSVARLGAKDETGPAFNSMRNNMRKTQQQGKALNNQFRLMRGGAGQVGHQIQDIAVQLQMGTNAMIVFGQQGSQIASLFGPQGAMLGAVLAVGAAIGVAFTRDTKAGSDALEELQEKIEETVKKTGDLRTEFKAFLIDQYTAELKKAEKQQRDYNRTIAENAAPLAEAAQLTDDLAGLERTRANQGKVTEKQSRLTQIGVEGLNAANNAAAAGLSILTAEIAETTQALADLDAGILPEEVTGALADAKKGFDAFMQSIEKATVSTSQGKVAVRAYELSLLGLEGAQLDTALAALGRYEQTLLDAEADKEAAAATALREKTERDMFAAIVNGMQASDEARKRDEAATKAARERLVNSQRTFADFRRELGDTYLQVRKLEDGLVGVTDNAMASFTDSFYDAISGAKSFKDAFKDMARSIVEDLSKMLIQYYITQQIFGAITSMFPGGGTTTTPAAGGGKSSSPMGTFEGGGFTGYGARTGGVDGRGGFPAILHPNETVVDHTQSGMGGVVINQTINVSTGVQQTVRAEIANMLPQIGNAAKAAVADARMRGGGFSKAIVGS